MASRSFENPLIPHARMRAMYRAMLEVRALSASLPRVQRLARQTEACWVAPAIGLEPQDLVSTVNTALVAHIREAATRTGTASRSAIRRFQNQPQQPFQGSSTDRLFFAAGQAAALKDLAPQSVLLAFAGAAELTAADWQRLFAVVAGQALPLVLTVLPSTRAEVDLSQIAGKTGSTPLAVIPVEASDPLAIYRVAQEALGRARAGGGPAVIECVRSAADPVAMLAGQMLARRVNTAAWLAAVQPQTIALFS